MINKLYKNHQHNNRNKKNNRNRNKMREHISINNKIMIINILNK